MMVHIWYTWSPALIFFGTFSCVQGGDNEHWFGLKRISSYWIHRNESFSSLAIKINLFVILSFICGKRRYQHLRCWQKRNWKSLDEGNFQSNESFIIVPSQVTIKDLCIIDVALFNLYSVWNKFIKNESYPRKINALFLSLRGQDWCSGKKRSKTKKLLMRTGSIYLKVTNSKSELWICYTNILKFEKDFVVYPFYGIDFRAQIHNI